ncbi:MAG: hypothetical protein R3B57_08500 [Phycisphaerales bacterium]
MHILTKVFVLFAAILSVLMAALAISYTANAGRIVDDYNHMKATVTAANESLSARSDIFDRELNAKNQQIESLRQQIAEHESTIRDLDARYSESVVQAEQARHDADTIRAQISQLGVATGTQAKIIDSYRDELQELRVAELRWKGEKLDIEDELADQESRIRVYEQTQRSLREQLATAQQEIEVLRRGGAVAANGRAAGPVEIQGPAIRGVVQKVAQDSNGATLLQISLGQRDHVDVNNKLYLVRGAKYLGEMVVEEPDVNTSVGRVLNLSSSDIKIREGDAVLSRLVGN